MCVLYFAKADLLAAHDVFPIFATQNEEGLDYEDAAAVQATIPETWWLNSLSCKYMLSCFVHKDCKDLSTRPTELGTTGRAQPKSGKSQQHSFWVLSHARGNNNQLVHCTLLTKDIKMFRQQ